MRMYSLKVLLLALAAVFVLASCQANNYANRLDSTKDRVKTSKVDTEKINLAQNGGSPDVNLNNKQNSFVLPVKSGPTTVLPWEKDGKFQKVMKDNDTPVLLGAYQTVLRDPLPGEEYNVHLAAGMLAGIVLEPGETFSQNGRVGPYIESRGFQKGPTYIGTQLTTTIGGGVCKIASTLYNVAILGNLQIVERHNHGMPVPYVPYGQDATVAYGAKDIKFRNNTDYPVMIWAQGIDNVLFIAFYGKEKSPEIIWHHETLETTKAPRVYRVNNSLPSGSEKVALEGMDGAVVRSWITIKYPDGSTEEKKLGNSYYKPMPFIIERGP